MTIERYDSETGKAWSSSGSTYTPSSSERESRVVDASEEASLRNIRNDDNLMDFAGRY